MTERANEQPSRVAPAHPVAMHHPDRTSAWVIALIARAGGDRPFLVPSEIERNLSKLLRISPMLASRLHGDQWIAAEAPSIQWVDQETDPIALLPLHHFDLGSEAPIRLVGASDGTWLALCAHHFAFDGLAMVAVLRGLVTGSPEEIALVRPSGGVSPPELPWPVLRRALSPVDAVAFSAHPNPSEVLLARRLEVAGKDITARLSAACALAVVEHNRRLGIPMRKLGISVAVGGIGKQSATYRRIDVLRGQPISHIVKEALESKGIPRELVALPRAASLLRPFLGRLSDTILVSNLGRHELGAVAQLDFFPVARGRSAVAFGLASIPGQQSTLSIRTLFLSRPDAQMILDRTIEEFDHELSA